MNKTKVEKNIMVVMLILACLILSSCTTEQAASKSTSQTQDSYTVRFGNINLVHSLPLYVAIGKGYFEQEGINIEITNFQAPNQLVDALLQRHVDIGSTCIASGIAAIADSKNPGKIKAYSLSGGDISTSNEWLIVSSNSSITRGEDLANKKIGILGGSIQWQTIAKELLAEYGLDQNVNVTVIGLPPTLQVQALVSGQIDALLALDPVATIAKTQGVSKIIESAPVERRLVDPFYPGFGVVSVEFVEKHPELAKKVIRIITRSIEEISQNPEAYSKYLFNNTPLTLDIATQVKIPVFKSCNLISEKDTKAVNAFYDIFKENGLLPANYSFKDISYCEEN